MSNLTFQQLEQLVAQAGGTPTQQEYLAGIAAGVESGGNPTAKNPDSTASGLWQELTTTWLSNGGGQYAPTAAQASPLDQAIVAVKQSVNGYQPWAPDLGGSYYGGDTNPQSPAPGSPVANYLAKQTNTTYPTQTPSSSSSGGTGLNANPLDGFGILNSLTGGAVNGIISAVSAPLKQWFEDGFLIVAGVVFILVGLVLLVRASGNNVPGGGAPAHTDEADTEGVAELAA